LIRPCAIYARVSTKKEAQAASIPQQVEACRRFAAGAGLRIIHEERDDGVSGRKGRDAREGWDRLLKWIEAGGLPHGGVVVVWDLDRWSRDWADGLIEALQLHRRGIGIADTKDGELDLATLTGQVMLSLKAAGAAEYVTKLSRAVKRSLEARTAQGYWMWPPPYGYQSRQGAGGRELIAHPDHAPHVLRVYQWADAGVTPIEIARRLNRAGHPPRRGDAWSGPGVRRILYGAAYGGLIQRWRAGQEVPGRIEQFIPPDLWARVRARYAPGRRGPSAPARAYPLSGLVTCASCGRRCWIEGTFNRGSEAKRRTCAPRYVCQGWRHGTCSNRSRVLVSSLEAAVLAWWRTLLDAGELEAAAQAAVEIEYAEALSAARDRAPLEAQLAELDRQETALIDLRLAGSSTELVVQRIQQVQERRDVVRATVRALGATVAPVPLAQALAAARAALADVHDVRELRPYLTRLTLYPDGAVTVEGFGQGVQQLEI
jgi:DNA invertase Pin-like site-specific DNA recombinase